MSSLVDTTASTPAAPAVAMPPRRTALAALSLTMLLPSLGTSIANVSLPALSRAFDAPFQNVQWIVLGYLLSMTALIVGAGRLGDLTGRRRLLLAGIALFTIASALSGAASTLWLLVLARAMQGLGAAVMMALGIAIASEIAPKERVGVVMGLLGTMSAVGTALGPALGGFLVASFGWPAIFLVKVPLGVLAFLFAWTSLPPGRAIGGKPGFDFAGTLVLALALAAYALGMTIGRGSFGATNAALIAAAAVLGVLFLAVEKRAAAPLIRSALFHNPTFSAGLALNLLVSSVIMATLVVGPFYLTGALRLEPTTVGLLLSAGPVTAALTGIIAGRLADRFGAPVMTTAGLAAMLAGALALALVPATLGIPGYLMPIVVTTAGYAVFQTANNTSVMAEALPDQRGMVSGMLSLSRNLGLITGTAALGAVFTIAAGGSDPGSIDPAAISNGMHATFAVGAVLVSIGTLVSIRRLVRS